VAARDQYAVKVEGAREVRAALRKLEADMTDLTALHRGIAELVLPAAVALVPNTSGRGTGALAASLRPRGTRTRATIGSRLVYAPIVHFGWPARSRPASPYIQAAIEANATAILDRYERGMAAILAPYQ
jgi:hypothetical protein